MERAEEENKKGNGTSTEEGGGHSRGGGGKQIIHDRTFHGTALSKKDRSGQNNTRGCGSGGKIIEKGHSRGEV